VIIGAAPGAIDAAVGQRRLKSVPQEKKRGGQIISFQKKQNKNTSKRENKWFFSMRCFDRNKNPTSHLISLSRCLNFRWPTAPLHPATELLWWFD
jgi:hypothetical protein